MFVSAVLLGLLLFSAHGLEVEIHPKLGVPVFKLQSLSLDRTTSHNQKAASFKLLACDANCASCADDTFTCLQCVAGMFMSGGTCVSQCQAGLYGENGMCVVCPDTCATCDSASSCTSCRFGFELSNGACISPTPQPTPEPTPEPTPAPTPEPTPQPTPEPTVAPTPEPTPGPTPEPTPAPTPEPTEPPTPSCQPNQYLENNQCKACANGCVACSGPNACTQCDPAASPALKLVDGVCHIEDCAEGQYIEGGSCRACPSACASCTSASVCTTCRAGYSLQDNQCVTNCPPATFRDGNDCKPCGENCKTCLSASQCTACVDSFALTAGACVKAADRVCGENSFSFQPPGSDVPVCYSDDQMGAILSSNLEPGKELQASSSRVALSGLRLSPASSGALTASLQRASGEEGLVMYTAKAKIGSNAMRFEDEESKEPVDFWLQLNVPPLHPSQAGNGLALVSSSSSQISVTREVAVASAPLTLSANSVARLQRVHTMAQQPISVAGFNDKDAQVTMEFDTRAKHPACAMWIDNQWSTGEEHILSIEANKVSGLIVCSPKTVGTMAVVNDETVVFHGSASDTWKHIVAGVLAGIGLLLIAAIAYYVFARRNKKHVENPRDDFPAPLATPSNYAGPLSPGPQIVMGLNSPVNSNMNRLDSSKNKPITPTPLPVPVPITAQNTPRTAETTPTNSLAARSIPGSETPEKPRTTRWRSIHRVDDLKGGFDASVVAGLPSAVRAASQNADTPIGGEELATASENRSQGGRWSARRFSEPMVAHSPTTPDAGSNPGPHHKDDPLNVDKEKGAANSNAQSQPSGFKWLFGRK